MADIFFPDFGKNHSQSFDTGSFFFKCDSENLEKTSDVCLNREGLIISWFLTSTTIIEISNLESPINKEKYPRT